MIKNELEITKPLMLSWAKEYRLRGRNVLLFVLWCIIAAVCLAGAIVLPLLGGGWVSSAASAVACLLAVYKLFFERFYAMSRRYAILSKQYGAESWWQTVSFESDGLHMTVGTQSAKIPYSHVASVKEEKESAFLFFQNGSTVRLYKNAFTEGTWEECRALLCERCRGISFEG